MRILVTILILIFSIHAWGKPPVESAINQAVINNNNTEVERLINAGLSQSELDRGLIAAAGKNNIEAAKLLLKAGADPNKNAGVGYTSVVIASFENSPEVLELLLMNGGNPNVKDIFEWRPLHHSMKSNYSHTKVMKVLLENGAEVDARTNLQITPLHRAAGFGHVEAVKLLLRYGADKTLKDKYGNNAYNRASKNGHKSVMSVLK